MQWRSDRQLAVVAVAARLSRGSRCEYFSCRDRFPRDYSADASAGLTIDLNAGKVTGSGGDTLISIENATGGSGNDNVWGNSGDNVLHGGSGNDTIDGGSGNDFVYGDAGDDFVVGGWGDDFIDGGTGADTMHGSLGNDTFGNFGHRHCAAAGFGVHLCAAQSC